MSKTEIACRRCYGTGKLYTPIKKNAGEPTYICPDCKGKKKLTATKPEASDEKAG